jgi:hypothetical protein
MGVGRELVMGVLPLASRVAARTALRHSGVSDNRIMP